MPPQGSCIGMHVQCSYIILVVLGLVPPSTLESNSMSGVELTYVRWYL